MTNALPTFIVIGAMKSGSTTLARHLSGHPDVFVSDPKEPSYFVSDRAVARRAKWYQSLFTDGAGCRARGEASTDYTKAPGIGGVPARIHAVVPDVRLIYLVRDPVDRILSHYLEERSLGTERRAFEQAVLEDPKYVDASRYGYQLSEFLTLFDREQLLVVSTNQLEVSPGGVLHDVFTFLGVDPERSAADLDLRLNTRDTKVELPAPLGALRRTIGPMGLLRSVPLRAKLRVRRVLGRRIPVPVVSADLAEQLRERLAADVPVFRSIVGPDSRLMTEAWLQ